MPKIKMNFQVGINLVNDFGYQPGQSVERSIEQLNALFTPVTYDEATIQELMRMVDPTYTITDKDRERAQARSELSEKARLNFFRFLHDKAEADGSIKIERGLHMLLDYSKSPESEAHNQKVLNAFAVDEKKHYINSSIEERTQIMKDFLDKMEQKDYSYLYTISDEELAEEFPKLFTLLSLTAEGGDAILRKDKSIVPDTPVFDLGPEYIKKLNNFKQNMQCLVSSLKGRFDYIMNPNYALLNVDRVAAPDIDHEPESSFSDRDKPLGLRMEGDNSRDIDPDEDLCEVANTFMNYYNLRNFSWSDRANFIAKSQGMDPKNMEYVKADGTVINALDLTGVKHFNLRDKTTGRTITCHSNGRELSFLENPSLGIARAKRGGEDLLKALEDADPWYIRMFTGSSEFNNMKAQMKAVVQGMNKLNNGATNEQLDQMATMARELLTKTTAYLDMKGIMDEDTKDSERARIMAAKGIQEYAERAILSLGAVKQMHLENIANAQNKIDKNQDGAKVQWEEEEAYARPREFTKETHDLKVQEEKATNNKATKFDYQEFTHILDHYYFKVDNNDPLKALGKSITEDFSNFDKRFDKMAKMVTFELIMRERADGNGEMGLIEQGYLAQPENFVQTIRNNHTLNRVANAMDEKDYLDFVTAVSGCKGAQQLTDKVLQELQQNAQQLQADAPVVAKEQNGPVING